MKNTKRMILVVLVLLWLGLGNACFNKTNDSVDSGKTDSNNSVDPGKTDEHIHTYSNQWEYNRKTHFHRAICEHKDLIKDEEEHEFTDWSLSEDEKYEQRNCKVCEYYETRPNAHQCVYGEWSVQIKPTLDTDGKLVRACTSNVSHTEEHPLPKLSKDDYEYRKENDATCILKGKDSYTYTLNEQTFKFEVELDYGTHSYGKWEVATNPTKSTQGLLKRVCTFDSSHEDEFILPSLSDIDYDYNVEPAGCLEDGKEIYTLSKDGQDFKFECNIPSSGHTDGTFYDAYKHWTGRTCEHTVPKSNISDHSFDANGICTVCECHQSLEQAVIYTLNNTEDAYIASFNPEFKGNSILIESIYEGLPVKELGSSDFDGKDVLSITLPSSLLSIKEDVFKSFTSLREVYYDGTVENWCEINFCTRNSNPMVYASSFYQRGDIYWEKVTSIEIPEGVTRIGKYQFYGFSEFTDILLPSELEAIYEEAFAECSGIREFIIPDSVRQIRKNILVGTQLKKLTLPFLQGKNPSNYILADYIGYYFGVATSSFVNGWNHQDKLKSLEELTLTKVTSLGKYALVNLPNLKKLNLPDCLETLESDMIFTGCPNLEYNEYQNGKYLGNADNPYLLLVEMIDKEATTFDLPSQTKLIYINALSDSKITEIELSTNLIEIGEGAFKNSSLQAITIPNSLENINEKVFADCTDLKEVYLPTTIDSIHPLAFENSNQIKIATLSQKYLHILNKEVVEELYILDGTANMDLSQYPKLKKISIPEDIKDIGGGVYEACPDLEYNVLDDILYIGNEEQPYLWLITTQNKNIVTLDMHTETKYIYENAFKDCTQLEGVNFPYRLEIIGNNAFSGCIHLKGVSFHHLLEVIGENAFENCSDIGYLYFSDSSVSTLEIKSYAFANCTSLMNLTLPNHITYLGEGILSGCKQLTKLTLPFVGSSPILSNNNKEQLFGWIFSKCDNPEGMKRISQPYDKTSNHYWDIPATLKEVTIIGGQVGQYSLVLDTSTKTSFNNIASLEKLTIDNAVEVVYVKDVSVYMNFQPKYLSIPYSFYKGIYSKSMEKIVELAITTPVDDEPEGFVLNGLYTSLEKLSLVGTKVFTCGLDYNGYSLNSSLKEVNLPDNLEEIGPNAFKVKRDSQLAYIVLPTSLKKIGNDAFLNTTILYYLGTEEEWNKIEKGTIPSSVYYYSETESANGWHYVDGVPTLW